MVFEAVSESYFLTGLYILLNIDNLKINSKEIDVYYSVKNLDTLQDKEDATVRKPLHPIIEINFKRKLLVKQGEKAEIYAEVRIKPNLCFTVVEDRLENENGTFMLDLSSKYKVQNSNSKRFLIGKLLYYPESKLSRM